MTVRKANLYALGVLAIWPALMFFAAMKTRQADWGFFFAMLVLTLVSWGIGIFLGIVLAVIVKRPRIEPYLYMASQFAVIATITSFVVVAMFSRKKPSDDNVRDNHSFVNLDKSMLETEPRDFVRTAFLELESKFPDPNSFHLERYTTRWRDTVIDSKPDTLYFVYFAYLKQARALYAKVLVMDDVAVIDSMNMEKRPDLHESSTKAGVWARRGNLEDVKETLKDLPDSTRQQVLDNMKDH